MAKRSGEMWSRSPWPRGASSFVRRSATVTISAPAASAQARFCSKEAYLPVPMMRRERNARAPSVKPGSPVAPPVSIPVPSAISSTSSSLPAACLGAAAGATSASRLRPPRGSRRGRQRRAGASQSASAAPRPGSRPLRCDGARPRGARGAPRRCSPPAPFGALRSRAERNLGRTRHARGSPRRLANPARARFGRASRRPIRSGRGGSRVDDRPTAATIHLGAVRANYAELARRAAGREVIGVVKADAYGHGAAPVARSLIAAGCPRLAVATVAEGCALRAAGIGASILVLGGVHEAAEAALEAGLTPVVHHRGQADALRKAGQGAPVPVHVEVDTGMRRMGVPPEEALELPVALARDPALRLEGVYTHLARADELDLAPTLEQVARLRALLAEARARGVEPGLVHCANSAGLLAGEALSGALPEAGAVRPGGALYGVTPAPHLAAPLRPAMTLRTRVVHLRAARAGDAVGYNALYRAQRRTRIATLAIGYADGVPVGATGRGEVVIRGRRCPFAGRVSMDFVGVDAGPDPVEVGDEAILFGESEQGRLPVEEAARAAGTIAYEMLVRVGARVRRAYAD